jgi:hypothetical protein
VASRLADAKRQQAARSPSQSPQLGKIFSKAWQVLALGMRVHDEGLFPDLSRESP